MPRVRVNGLELHYVVDNYTDPWLPHETVLMHHGIMRSHRWFYGWVPTIARHYVVVRMDARGHGESEAPPWVHKASLDTFAGDALGIIDALGLEKVHYIGESFGGVIGTALAAKHSDRLHSLTLCSTPMSVSKGGRNVVHPGGYKDRATAMEALGQWGAYLASAQPPVQPPGLIEQLKQQWIAAEHNRAALHVGQSIARFVYDSGTTTADLLPRIRVPTLLITPGSSPVATQEEQKLMVQRIPDCRQVQVPQGGHSIYLDYPEQCAQAALKFLQERSMAIEAARRATGG